MKAKLLLMCVLFSIFKFAVAEHQLTVTVINEGYDAANSQIINLTFYPPKVGGWAGTGDSVSIPNGRSDKSINLKYGDGHYVAVGLTLYGEVDKEKQQAAGNGGPAYVPRTIDTAYEELDSKKVITNITIRISEDGKISIDSVEYDNLEGDDGDEKKE